VGVAGVAVAVELLKQEVRNSAGKHPA
jgi:hypothetical protein